MSNLVSRYSRRYEKLVRANTVTPFPKNVFMRSQNNFNTPNDRVGDRTNCFESTMIHLTERFNNREVFLVGTMNKSTMLATRTKKLIEDVQPDTVLVQTSPEWWKVASLLRYVETQEEFDRYSKDFKHIDTFENMGLANIRAIVAFPRLWLINKLARWHYRFGMEYNPVEAGLEMKYACEAAVDTNAKLGFMGGELNAEARHALVHETRHNVFTFLWKKYNQLHTRWAFEQQMNREKIMNNGVKAFTEQCMDQYLMNWYIKNTEVLFPGLKKVLVDYNDEALFKKIDRAEGKKIVVLVNQWHMEGIEHQWCHAYGQNPRSVHFDGEINPIGDMDLRRGLVDRLWNALQREIKSAEQKSVPSTFSDIINQYHRETVFHYEHRDM